MFLCDKAGGSMPNKLKTPCAFPGCPELCEIGQQYCYRHQRQKRSQYDKERGSAAKRGYDTRWKKARALFLKEHPLCVKCLQEGKITLATVVDHIVPHKGDYELFWDENNWQPLCKFHHDQKTAKEDGRWG